MMVWLQAASENWQHYTPGFFCWLLVCFLFDSVEVSIIFDWSISGFCYVYLGLQAYQVVTYWLLTPVGALVSTVVVVGLLCYSLYVAYKCLEAKYGEANEPFIVTLACMAGVYLYFYAVGAMIDFHLTNQVVKALGVHPCWLKLGVGAVVGAVKKLLDKHNVPVKHLGPLLFMLCLPLVKPTFEALYIFSVLSGLVIASGWVCREQAVRGWFCFGCVTMGVHCCLPGAYSSVGEHTGLKQLYTILCGVEPKFLNYTPHSGV